MLEQSLRQQRWSEDRWCVSSLCDTIDIICLLCFCFVYVSCISAKFILNAVQLLRRTLTSLVLHVGTPLVLALHLINSKIKRTLNYRKHVFAHWILIKEKLKKIKETLQNC